MMDVIRYHRTLRPMIGALTAQVPSSLDVHVDRVFVIREAKGFVLE